MAIDRYRIYCDTDSKWEFVFASSPPTVCPTDGGHTVRSDSVVKVQSDVLVNDGTAKSLALPDYKQLRHNEIDGNTKALIGAGFTYDSKTFSASINAQTNWNTLKDQEAEFTWPVNISTLDNDEYSLTAANLDAFWIAARDAIKGHLDSGRTLKKTIFDAANESAVDAVVDSR